MQIVIESRSQFWFQNSIEFEVFLVCSTLLKAARRSSLIAAVCSSSIALQTAPNQPHINFAFHTSRFHHINTPSFINSLQYSEFHTPTSRSNNFHTSTSRCILHASRRSDSPREASGSDQAAIRLSFGWLSIFIIGTPRFNCACCASCFQIRGDQLTTSLIELRLLDRVRQEWVTSHNLRVRSNSLTRILLNSALLFSCSQILRALLWLLITIASNRTPDLRLFTGNGTLSNYDERTLLGVLLGVLLKECP